MSLNAIMNTALTGLFTSQAGLRVTSSNIANVNTPGYAREVVRQEHVINGSYGGGVRIADVERVVDRFLEDSLYSARGQTSRYATERQFHDRIQALLGRPDSSSSLSGRLDSMFQKLGAVAEDPSRLVLRQDALSGIQDFASEISRLSDEIQKLRADASFKIAENVTTVNTLLKRIDSLNPLITRETVLGNATGPLEEQRAQALTELSQLVDVRVHEQGDGSIHITTTNGTVLLGGARYELKYKTPGTASSETIYSPITMHVVDPTTEVVASEGAPLDGALLGGELKGLVNLRDSVLPDMAAELGQLAGTVSDRLNAIHNGASAYPPPASLSGRNTGALGTDLHGFSGQTSFKITDAGGQVVSTVSIDFDALPAGATLNDVVGLVNAGLGGAGTLSLSGGVMSFAAAGAGNGVMIIDDPDSPSGRAGRGFSHFFGMNDLVQAKVASHYDTGFAPADIHGFVPGGTVNFEIRGEDNRKITDYTLTMGGGDFASILADLNDPAGLGQYLDFSLDSNGQLVSTPKPGFDGLSINVKSDSTDRGGTGVTLSALFGIGERYLADRAGGLKVNEAIAKSPQKLALGMGTFAAGTGQGALTVGNGEAARALQDLELAVLDFEATGKLSSTSASLGQYAAAILSNMGLQAAHASGREADTKALATEVEQRRNAVSGVNLDEELSNMVIFQNSYNASARIISTVREMYDALLGIV